MSVNWKGEQKDNLRLDRGGLEFCRDQTLRCSRSICLHCVNPLYHESLLTITLEQCIEVSNYEFKFCFNSFEHSLRNGL
ncbi:hypothetical protein ACSQ67_025727 [Phaseolus vulgaris]